jgi:hypothetical protein
MKRRIFKTIAIALTCSVAISASAIIGNTIAAPAGGYSSTLMTPEALNSPLLNNNFTSDEWNPNEILIWGIFLSNFLEVGIDSYQSAFSEGFGGSEGAGYKALQFSTGQEKTNEKVIKELTEYAISSARGMGEGSYTPLYTLEYALGYKVGKGIDDTLDLSAYDHVLVNNTAYKYDKDEKVLTENSEKISYLKPTTLGDLLWMENTGDVTVGGILSSDKAYAFVPGDNGYNDSGLSSDKKLANNNNISLGEYAGMYSFEDRSNEGNVGTAIVSTNRYRLGRAYVPYVTEDGVTTYHEIWDNNDSYDMQLMSIAMTKWYDYWENKDKQGMSLDSEGGENGEAIELERILKTKLYKDVFGNIGYIGDSGDLVVILPSCINQHVGLENKLRNMLNSFNITGGSLVTLQEDWLVREGAQNEEGSGVAAVGINSKYTTKFYSPLTFTEKSTDDTDGLGEVVAYYDTSSFAYRGTNYGAALLGLTRRNGDNIGDPKDSIVPIKFDYIGGEQYVINAVAGYEDDFLGAEDSDQFDRILLKMYLVKSNLADLLFALYSSKQGITEVLGEMYDFTIDSEGMSVFGDGAYVTPQVSSRKTDTSGFKKWTYETERDFVNYAMKEIEKGAIEVPELSRSVSYRMAADALFFGTGGSGELYRRYIDNRRNKYVVMGEKGRDILTGDKVTIKLDELIGEQDSTYGQAGVFQLEPLFYIGGVKQSGIQIKNDHKKGDWASGFAESTEIFPGRIIKVFGLGSELSVIGDYLNITAEDAVGHYASNIYYSYLKFYGLVGKGEEGTVNLNPAIVGGELTYEALFEAVSNSPTNADLQKNIMSNASLMLGTDEASREYRKQVKSSGIIDSLKGIYQDIVADGVDVQTDSSAISSKSGSFLNVNTYDENIFTGWFVKIYMNIIVFIVGILVVSCVVFGLLKNKKASWVFITVFTCINTILVLPSIGELVPYVTRNITQKGMAKNSTYWSLATQTDSLSSGVSTDSSNEKYQGLSDTEKMLVNSMLSTQAMLEVDRTLMVKKDISSKTIYSTGTLSDVVKLKSTQWMLPLIVRQFTANNEREKFSYVYTPISDLYENGSNWLWYLRPNILTLSEKTNYTATQKGISTESFGEWAKGETVDGGRVLPWDSNTFNDDVNQKLFVENIGELSADWSTLTRSTDTFQTPDGRSREYERSYVYSDSNFAGTPGDYNTLTHLYSFAYPEYVIEKQFDGRAVGTVDYGITKINIPTDFSKYGGMVKDEDRDKYIADVIANNVNVAEKMNLMSLQIQDAASKYYIYDRTKNVYPNLGYLWATENPYNYMYQVASEYWDQSSSIGTAFNTLLGSFSDVDNSVGDVTDPEYVPDTDSYDGIRIGALYDNKSGEVVDVLDLEGMFRVMIPYIYGMQLVAGDTLDGKLIDQYTVYNGSEAAWLFRSNWATKIIENPSFIKGDTVRDSNGTKYKVANPAVPGCYPINRPMIFSDAMRVAYELEESDLSIVELKLVKINREVAEKWTNLINYRNLEGMNLEILQRQMALDAMCIFMGRIESGGIFATAFDMFPKSLDLRSISFDSVMNMLLLNVTDDSSYIYGNSIDVYMENGNIVGKILLVMVAFLCCTVVPLGRDLIMAVSFFCGFVTVGYNIMGSSARRVMVTASTLVSNIIICIATSLYYGLFSILMNVTTPDSVLTDTGAVSFKAGSPVFLFIIIIAVSILYLFFCYKFIQFCFANVRDGGAEMFAGIMMGLRDKVSGTVRGMGSSISGGLSHLRNTVDGHHKERKAASEKKNLLQNAKDKATGKAIEMRGKLEEGWEEVKKGPNNVIELAQHAVARGRNRVNETYRNSRDSVKDSINAEMDKINTKIEHGKRIAQFIKEKEYLEERGEKTERIAAEIEKMEKKSSAG